MNRFVLIALLFLGGCATRAPEALPPSMQPKAFTEPTVAAEADPWPAADWWRGFGDPDLTALILQARDANRDLAQAAARVTQAEARSSIQRSALYPQLGLEGGHVDGGCQGPACAAFTSQNAFGLTFNASYELDFWGLARSNLRAAEHQLEAARFAREAAAVSVTANVADQYLDVLALRGRIAIAHDNIAAINGLLDVVKLRVKAGAASRLDLAREEAQVDAVEAELPGLETQEQQALHALAVLLGRPPEGFDVKAQNLDGVRAPVAGAGLPADLLRRRPDVAQAEANLAAAHANVDAARAAFFPQVSLTGTGGFSSGGLGALLHGGQFGYAYGVNLLQAVFDGGRLAGQKRLAEGVQKECVAAYQAAALNAYADVENALVEMAKAGRAEEQLRQEVEAAREAFNISGLQYRQGAADLLTVLQAQQTLFSAEDQLEQAMLARRQAAVHLFEALGGGWMEDVGDRTRVARIGSRD
jgi:NodT family efflux transporter outer membrane factor (OMF) lipoprotein